MILYVTLQRDMGLKYFMVVRWFIFGIRTMVVLFIWGGKVPYSRQLMMEPCLWGFYGGWIFELQ